MKHAIVKLTIDEAIALNNYTMELLKENPRSKAAINRASEKLLAALDEADPVETP